MLTVEDIENIKYTINYNKQKAAQKKIIPIFAA